MLLWVIPPITNPVGIFTLIITLILFVPYISKRIKVPSIFGLIVAGVIIGPNGLGLLNNMEGISVFSSVGLLYLMFLAGLEINSATFKKNRNKSVFFGLATFIIPLGIGFPVLYYLLGYSFLPSLLISSMFSTHTLLSYPITSRLNINNREQVVVTVGGTIFTDTAVLILLSIITTAHNGKLNGLFWLQLLLLLSVFVFVVLWGLPKIARWYFNTFQNDSTSHYIFVLVAMFVSSIMAKGAGIEPIVGAFLAGLALNKVIPHHSPLMNRTEFIGNSLFIPFFLISVGMLVNLKVLFKGFDTLLLSTILIAVAIAGKYFAAQVTRIFYRYTKTEGNLIFGLSASHAAATIAVILVGFELKILDERVLNGTILLILATSMVSTFVTEKSARIIALDGNEKLQEFDHGPDKIVVPVANPNSFNILFELALITKEADPESKIFPLFIINDGNEDHSSIAMIKSKMNDLMQHAASMDTVVSPITRLDINIPTGISRAVKELQANKIIMGWSGRSYPARYFFGDIIDNLIESTQQMIMVVKVKRPLYQFRNILVMVPSNADKEIGFYSWVNSLILLSKNTGGKLIFLSNAETLAKLKLRFKEYKTFTDKNFILFEYYPNFSSIPIPFDREDLVVAIAARPSTISFNKRQMIIPKLLSQYSDDMNFIVIYPEQVEKPSGINVGLDQYFKV